MSLDEWNDEVETRVNIQSVPGMGQFDIDGLEPEEQVQLALHKCSARLAAHLRLWMSLPGCPLVALMRAAARGQLRYLL